MPVMKNRELDLSEFPAGTVTEFTTLVCLACIFDIFTKQLGLAPRTAFSEIKRHTPEIEELTTRSAKRPYFDSDEKHHIVRIANLQSVGSRVSIPIASKAVRRLMRRAARC